MMGRKKAAAPVEDEDFDYAAAEAEALAKENDDNEDDDNPFSTRPRLVDPMTTSLGNERELEPYPGPPIFDGAQVATDDRPLFASVRLFTPDHMPSEPLQRAYTDWLSDGSGDRICLPHYLLSADDFEKEMDTTGEVLTDDEIAQLDAAQEAETAQAVAESEARTVATDDDAVQAGESAPPMADPPTSPIGGASPEPPAMTRMEVPFVLGHLTVARLPSWGEALLWSASDPVERSGGYGGGTHLHVWLPLEEDALRVPPTGEFERSFVVHCVDRPSSTELRAKTREAHLEWLRASGRVARAGPLLASPTDAPRADGDAGSGASAGARVGSLLLVSGDDVAEVRDWAARDPYCVAGLFEQVTIAPLAAYGLPSLLTL